MWMMHNFLTEKLNICDNEDEKVWDYHAENMQSTKILKVKWEGQFGLG